MATTRKVSFNMKRKNFKQMITFKEIIQTKKKTNSNSNEIDHWEKNVKFQTFCLLQLEVKSAVTGSCIASLRYHVGP
jgi:hypothetical protein